MPSREQLRGAVELLPKKYFRLARCRDYGRVGASSPAQRSRMVAGVGTSSLYFLYTLALLMVVRTASARCLGRVRYQLHAAATRAR